MGHEQRVTPEEARWKATIFVASPDLLLNQGLQKLLEEKDIRVVGSSLSAQPMIEALGHTPTNALLIDRELPGLHLPSLMLTASKSGARVILRASEFDPLEIAIYLKYGVNRAVIEDDSLEVHIQTILATKNNRIYRSPRIAETYRLAQEQECEIEPLTSRQAQVLNLLVQGYKNQEVADQLCMSVKTVEYHRYRLLRKTSHMNRSELAKIARALIITTK